MEPLVIDFSLDYINWKLTIGEALDLRHIYRSPYLVDSIIKSVLVKTFSLLEQEGIDKKLLTYSKRIVIVQILKENGKFIKIMSKKELWVYLEYFFDLTDFSKYFDIQIVQFVI